MPSEADNIGARRDALRRKYRHLYDQIAEILFCADPAGINFEDNTDEYHPETDTILPRLDSCKSKSEVRIVVIEEFSRWFDDDTIEKVNKNKFNQIAAETWHALEVFRGRKLLTNNTEQNIRQVSSEGAPSDEPSM